MRGITRKSIRTRSGVSEIRVERGRLNRRDAGDNILLIQCFGIPEPLPSLADDIARRLRDRIAFPAEFWKGVE